MPIQSCGQTADNREPLTERQAAIYDYIVHMIRWECRPPSMREIADRFSMSAAPAASHVIDALIKKGWITKGKGSRSYAPTKPDLFISEDDGSVMIATSGIVFMTKAEFLELAKRSCA